MYDYKNMITHIYLPIHVHRDTYIHQHIYRH